MAKILLVEDHFATAQTLQNFLIRRHQFYYASSLQEAYQFLATQSVDLAIIDRQLPDGDGLDLIEYLNDNLPFTRHLILTDLKSDQHIFQGYQAQVDDYLPKPFNLEIISLRIHNLLTKIKTNLSAVIPWGDFSYFPSEHLLQFNSQQKLTLTPKEAIIFEHLLLKINRPVGREEFVDLLFNRDNTSRRVNSRTIDTTLRRLRTKLGNYGQYLKAVHGLGYQLTAPASPFTV